LVDLDTGEHDPMVGVCQIFKVHNSYIWITAIEHSAKHFGQLAM